MWGAYIKNNLILIGLILAAGLGCVIQLSLWIDPFVSQLVVIPFFVIGIGVVSAYFTHTILIAPLVTFLLNVLYSFVAFSYFYPGDELTSDYLFAWSIIFPVLSFIIACVVSIYLKLKKPRENN